MDYFERRGVDFKSKIPPKIYKDGWEEIGVYPNVAVFLKRNSDFKYPHGGRNELLISFADGDETYTKDSEQVKQVMMMLAADRVGNTKGFARIGSMPSQSRGLAEDLQRSIRVESLLWDFKYYPDVAPWDDGSYGSQYQEPTWIESNTTSNKYGAWQDFPQFRAQIRTEGAMRLMGELEDDDWDDEYFVRTPEWDAWFERTKQNELRDSVERIHDLEEEKRNQAIKAAEDKFKEIRRRKYDFSTNSSAYLKRKNKAPLNKRRRRMVRETKFAKPIPVKGTDLKMVGLGMDKNGNSVVRLKPMYGNARGFSIQTNGNLPALHRMRNNYRINNTNKTMFDPTGSAKSTAMINKQIADYIDKYGTPRQTKMALNRESGGRLKYPKRRGNVGYYGGASNRRRR